MKRYVCCLLSMFMIIIGITCISFAETDTDQTYKMSGKCGDNLTWKLVEQITEEGFTEYGLLIEGAGDMYDYGLINDGEWIDAPWDSAVPPLYITSVKIENGVNSIGKNAFSSTEYVRTVQIPQSVSSIGEVAFSDCSNLKEIIVDKNNEAYRSVDGILFDKKNSQLLKYPAGRDAESFKIPEGITYIADRAFFGCDHLTSIKIPKTVTEIGKSVFSNCKRLDDISVEEGNDSYESRDGLLISADGERVLQYAIGRSSVSCCIPDGVREIEAYAFYGCNHLEKIIVPDSIVSIGQYSFANTSNLKYMMIGNSLKEIEEQAFRFSGLEKIDYNGTKEEWEAVSIQASFPAPDLEAIVVFLVSEKPFDLPRFIDVREDDWFAEAVAFVSERRFFIGTGEDTFSPEMEMTRAMFVTVLGRMAQIDDSAYGEPAFEDVPAGQWYTGFVQWAVNSHIIEGYNHNIFGPDDPVTREQMMVMLYRFAICAGVDVSDIDTEKFVDFNDMEQVSDYAENAMIWGIVREIIHGTESGLEPQKTATRAQIAQLMMNFSRIMGL